MCFKLILKLAPLQYIKIIDPCAQNYVFLKLFLKCNGPKLRERFNVSIDSPISIINKWRSNGFYEAGGAMLLALGLLPDLSATYIQSNNRASHQQASTYCFSKLSYFNIIISGRSSDSYPRLNPIQPENLISQFHTKYFVTTALQIYFIILDLPKHFSVIFIWGFCSSSRLYLW